MQRFCYPPNVHSRERGKFGQNKYKHKRNRLQASDLKSCCWKPFLNSSVYFASKQIGDWSMNLKWFSSVLGCQDHERLRFGSPAGKVTPNDAKFSTYYLRARNRSWAPAKTAPLQIFSSRSWRSLRCRRILTRRCWRRSSLWRDFHRGKRPGSPLLRRAPGQLAHWTSDIISTGSKLRLALNHKKSSCVPREAKYDHVREKNSVELNVHVSENWTSLNSQDTIKGNIFLPKCNMHQTLHQTLSLRDQNHESLRAQICVLIR